jgi:sarcosine oxidase subunit alpha
MTALRYGDVVAREHAWPNADRSMLAALDGPSTRMSSAGFQYRWFRKRPRAFALWERALARLAGRGGLPAAIAADQIARSAQWRQVTVDVAVVGGGPAGLAAARAASVAGASVLLVERGDELGGALLAGDAAAHETARRLADDVAHSEHIESLVGATAFGCDDNGHVGVTTANGVLEVAAGAVVLASGTYERRWAFDDADRPGVLLGHGAQLMINRHRVLPGRRAAIATDEDYGYELAETLIGVRAPPPCVIDVRHQPDDPDRADALRAAGVELIAGAHPVHVDGGTGGIRSVALRAAAGQTRRIDCDALLIAGGRRPALELLRQRAGAAGLTTAGAGAAAQPVVPGWWTAGGADGTSSIDAAMASGEAAGAAAARHSTARAQAS